MKLSKTGEFHDSNLTGVARSGNSLLLFLYIDTHWFPGEKYGKLILKNPTIPEGFQEAWEQDYEGWLQSIRHEESKGKHVFSIRFHNSQEKLWTIAAEDYSFERSNQSLNG